MKTVKEISLEAVREYFQPLIWFALKIKQASEFLDRKILSKGGGQS